MKKILFALMAIGLLACNTKPSDKTENAAPAEADPNVEWAVVTLEVEGMTCDGCEKAINAGVGSLEGIAEVESDHEAKYTKVKYDPASTSVDEISAKITDTGYEVKGEKDDENS